MKQQVIAQVKYMLDGITDLCTLYIVCYIHMYIYIETVFDVGLTGSVIAISGSEQTAQNQHVIFVIFQRLSDLFLGFRV